MAIPWNKGRKTGPTEPRTPKTCEICHNDFMAKDKRGRWCRTCVPPYDGTALLRAQLYGLSKPTYDAMVASQGNRCKICGTSPTGEGNFKSLLVDHDHTTGKVRGLLCQKCNLTVGFVETHQHVVEVLEYLRCHAAN